MKPGNTGSTLGKWLVLLATPLLWAVHFLLVYGVASVEITLRGEAGRPTLVITVVLTLAILVAIVALGWAAYAGRVPRWGEAREDLAALWRRCTLFLAVLSFAGVLWQGLPALLIPGAPESHQADGGGVNVPPRRDGLLD